MKATNGDCLLAQGTENSKALRPGWSQALRQDTPRNVTPSVSRLCCPLCQLCFPAGDHQVVTKPSAGIPEESAWLPVVFTEALGLLVVWHGSPSFLETMTMAEQGDTACQ